MAGSWIACNSSLALNRDIPTKDLHHIGWTVREGAPAGGVNSIAQSRDGYLWLASYSGLFRFDGLRFDRISFQHDDRLRSMTVYDVFAPTSGGLWMGFALGGVGFLDEKGSLTVYNYRDGLPSAPEHRLTEGPDGTIWIGTSAGIGRFVRGHWQPLQLEGLPEGSTSDSLLVDSDDTLWLATDQAIYYLPHGETKLHGPTSGFAGYVTLAESATGALWASDDRGLRFIHQSKRPSGKPRNAEYSMQFDRDGALWATQSGVVYRLSYPERMTDRVVAWTSIGDVFTRQNGLTSVNSYGSMLQDREGNFWLSTGEGLDRFSERNLADVPLPASLTGAGSQLGDLGVASAENGAVWIFAYDSMAHRDVDGRFETSDFIKNVSSVSRAQDGSLWAGTSKALWRFESGKWQRNELPKGAQNFDVQASAVAGDGTLWLSMVHLGVYARTHSGWVANGGMALPKMPALCMTTDSAGTLWLGFPENQLARIKNGELTLYSGANGLHVGNITGLYTRAEHVWVGGEFGLAVFDGREFHAVQPQIEHAFDGATGIVETAEGDLWINGSAGITHIEARAARAALSDPNVVLASETFDSTDGLSGTGARRIRPLPTAIQGSDQRLWFVTNTGVFAIDPEHISRNPEPPAVRIQGVYAGERAMRLDSPLILPKNATSIRVDYVGLSMSHAEKVRYRYKLDGVDPDWQNVQERHQAFYTNLSPGGYRFHVIASNGDGVWNDGGAALDIVIPPMFWQTKTFFGLCIAAILAMIAFLFRLRLRQSAARMRVLLNERMDERERIARELHDTLLQGTQGLMLQVQAAAMTISPDDPARVMLERAMGRADDVMSEGRNRVLDLRVTIDSYRSLSQSIEAVAEQLRTSANSLDGRAPAYRVTIEGDEREVLPSVRHEMYCVAREALLNASRHAAARSVDTRLIFGDRALRVVIADDGIGIDAGIAEARSRPDHWGLTGMHERARKVGASFDVRRRPSGGTEIEIVVPSAVAYRRQEWTWRRFFSAFRRKRLLPNRN